MEDFPESLEEFFDAFPEIGVANMLLTDMDHVSMWREEVLFIKQRQQATSDIRENKKVRWMGKILKMNKENVEKPTCLGNIIPACNVL